MSLLIARRGILAAGATAAPPSGDYAAEVAADSPFAWWRMEETAGSTATDEQGNHNGTVTGANLDVSGAPGTGSAVSFDGTDDYIDVGTLGNFGSLLGSGCSVEAWVKWTATTAHMAVMGQVDAGTSNFMQLRVNAGAEGRVQFAYRVAGGDRRGRDTDGVGYNDGEWHHVVATWSAAGEFPDLYIDGALDNGATSQGISGTSTGDFVQPLTIGARNNVGTLDSHYEGAADEPALYDKVLTPTRIGVHHTAGAS